MSRERESFLSSREMFRESIILIFPLTNCSKECDHN